MSAKYRQLAAVLRTGLLSGAYQGQTHLPTEQALSQRYHVSRQTVRQALALLSQEGLIQRRQGSGSRILFQNITPDSRTAVLLLPREDSDARSALAADLQAQLARYGFLLRLLPTENRWDREAEQLRLLLERPPAGLLTLGVKTALPNPNLPCYQALIRSGCPTVFLCPSSLPGAISITEDDAGGSYALTRALLSLGHLRLGGIFAADDHAGLARFQGFSAALHDRGLTCPDERIFWFTQRERISLLEQGDSTALRGFLRRCGCTALLCQDDEWALQTDLLLRRQSDGTPTQLASFGGGPLAARCVSPVLSVTRTPHQLGELAAGELVRQMTGEPAQSRQALWQPPQGRQIPGSMETVSHNH